MKMSKRLLSALLLAASVITGQAQSTTAPKKEKPKTAEQIRLDQMTEQMLQMERQMDAMKEQLQQAKSKSNWS